MSLESQGNLAQASLTQTALTRPARCVAVSMHHPEERLTSRTTGRLLQIAIEATNEQTITEEDSSSLLPHKNVQVTVTSRASHRIAPKNDVS
jgi:hypothetical protein